MACSRCGKSRSTNTPSGIRRGTNKSTGDTVKKGNNAARDAISGMKYVPGK